MPSMKWSYPLEQDGKYTQGLLLHTKSMVVVWRQSSWVMVCNVFFFFFHGRTFFLERRTDRQTVVTQSWVFGRHFLQNELNEPVTSAKQLMVSVTSDKIQAFK